MNGITHVYLPIDNIDINDTYVLYDRNTIRVFKEPLKIGVNNYTDYYINNHYINKTGKMLIESTEEMPIPFSSSIITNDIMYRNDIVPIFILASILFTITLIFPYLVFRRLFGRWLKI